MEVKERLKLHFKMKDMGSAHFLLGVEIRRRLEGGYFLVQEKYASEVVSKFGMAEAKVVTTPFEPGSTFGSDDVEDQEGVSIDGRNSLQKSGRQHDVPCCVYPA